MTSYRVRQLIAQYEDGGIASLELLSLLLAHLTLYPKEKDSVFAALKRHAEPRLHYVATLLIESLKKQQQSKMTGHDSGQPR